MEDRVTVPRMPFQIDYQWQLCNRNGPCAPLRMFQWEAINDLGDPSLASVTDWGYELRSGYSLARRHRPEWRNWADADSDDDGGMTVVEYLRWRRAA
jgi:hypothetical protein